MKSRVPFLSVVMVLFLLVGCSGKPSDSKIESMYKDYVTKTEGGKLLYTKMLDIKNFTKINGFDKDSRTYSVDVTFDRVFKIGSKDIPNTFSNDDLLKIFGRNDVFTSVPVLALKSSRDQNRPTPSVFSLYAYFEPGDRIETCSKFSIEMVNSDNGWVINNVTCSRPTDNQLENMIKAYERSAQLIGKDSAGVQRTEITAVRLTMQ